MATTAKNDARLNFRLPSDLKQVIEVAAAQLGQSVSDFAVSTLVRTARDIIRQQNITDLSNRDRDVFVAMLNDADAKPSEAITDAAQRYLRQVK